MANVLETFATFNSSLSLFSGRRRQRLVCEAAPQISPQKAGVGATSRSFGRLKVQRVKDLVKESYRKKKQGSSIEDYQQKAEDESNNDPDQLDEHNSVDEQKDMLDAFRSRVKSAGRAAASSDFPVTSSKRWGGVESVDIYRYKADDISKKGLKLKANSDFFSRESFNELGCSDYIVESLRKLQYIRPSHIQVH